MESAIHIGGVDPLSDVLKAVRLTGALFFLTDAGVPWVSSVPAASSMLDAVDPPPQHLISYHVMTRGSCWCTLEGESPVLLETGDVLVIPHGDPYAMCSAPSMQATGSDEETNEFLRMVGRRELPFMVRDGSDGAERIHVLCGFLGCDVMPFNPILGALPRRMHVRRPAERDRLDHLVDFVMEEMEARDAGSDCVLLRISELMFVEVVRRYLASAAGEEGWLSALRDPVAGRALVLLHNSPARGWTLELLAREAGVSRSLLAERFTSMTGQPPMHYLKQWRIQLAANLLSRGEATVGGVALEVGYDSEAAFSRAFKKEVGVSPSLWRKRRPAVDRGANFRPRPGP